MESRRCFFRGSIAPSVFVPAVKSLYRTTHQRVDSISCDPCCQEVASDHFEQIMLASGWNLYICLWIVRWTLKLHRLLIKGGQVFFCHHLRYLWYSLGDAKPLQGDNCGKYRKGLGGGIPYSKGILALCPVVIWVFPKIGVPQNGWFIVENPI